VNRQSFIFRSRNGLRWLEAPNLTPFPSIVQAFSTRAAGDFRSLSAALSSHSGGDIESEQHRFLTALDAERFEVASARQIHSAKIVQVTRGAGTVEYHDCESPRGHLSSLQKLEADALITSEYGVLLTIRTADCLPVLVADTRRGAIAAVHAGWRGALESIVGKTVHELQRAFDSDPRDLAVALGPSVRACCYVVGPEVVDAFCSRFAVGRQFFRTRVRHKAASSGSPPLPAGQAGANASPESPSYLDLVAVALDQLERAGVPGSHIEIADFCTSCRTDLFFSHREEGASTGRMLAVIGIREEFPSAGARASQRGTMNSPGSL
jgi:polyphenol oxidase